MLGTYTQSLHNHDLVEKTMNEVFIRVEFFLAGHHCFIMCMIVFQASGYGSSSAASAHSRQSSEGDSAGDSGRPHHNR